LRDLLAQNALHAIPAGEDLALVNSGEFLGAFVHHVAHPSHANAERGVEGQSA
jgi:hypothetical protein